jgi:cell fate regulator YaaT (PSP1 superfamily)
MDYQNMKYKISAGCDRGLCRRGVGRQDKQLNTYDWLADVPGNAERTDLVEVQFKNTRKGYYHNVNNLDLKKGDIVAVEANPGHDIGVVTLTGELVKLQIKKANLKSTDDIKRIYRLAKPVDMEKYEEAKSREHGTMIQSRQIAKDLGLDMKIGDVEYQGDGNKAIFYYIADERVDFRQLIKVLAEAFHVRIEMKQIGARQEAGRIGGTGPCGRELCCATWMKNFISVSTNAARFQDISLNPQKLAGMCAKLKCCLNYEVDNYMEAGKRLPSKDIVLQTLDADYYLFKTDILAGLVTYSTDKRTAANLEVITVDRAKDIIEMNKQGEKPMSLQEDGRQKGDDKTKDLLEGESITRFDKNKKKKKRKSKADKNAKTEVATEQAGKQDVNVEKQRPAGNNAAKDEQAGESKVKDQASAQMGESVADAKKMRKAQANRRAFKKTKPAGNSQEGGAQTTSDQQGRNEQNPGQQQ